MCFLKVLFLAGVDDFFALPQRKTGLEIDPVAVPSEIRDAEFGLLDGSDDFIVNRPFALHEMALVNYNWLKTSRSDC